MWVNKTFGCVTAHNLGIMVANPQDLIEGQPDTIADTYGAVRALQLYRTNFSSLGNLGSFGSLVSSLFGR
jgi:type IV pilus biogenesis protein CpaD/CtpE